MGNSRLQNGFFAIPLIVCAVAIIGLGATAIIAPATMKSLSDHTSNSTETQPTIDPATGNPVLTSNSTLSSTSGVPTPLKNLFEEIGQKTGVPPALLAAFSNRECGRLWNVDEATLTDWINNNKDANQMGCAFDNGYGVFGPAQFLWSTWGYSNIGDAPHGMPTNQAGYGYKSISYTNHTPPSIYNLRDAFYAMAIMVKANSGNNGGDWTEEQVKKAARLYCGACGDPACGGPTNDYCTGVWNLYQKYSSA